MQSTLRHSYDDDTTSNSSFHTAKESFVKKENIAAKYIHKFIPTISHDLKFVDDDKINHIQLVGEMMSGKSETMIAIQHYNILENKTVNIHLVADSGDIPQLIESIDSYNSRLENFCNSIGDKFQGLEYLEVSELGLDEDANVINGDEIYQTLTGKDSPKLIICLAHQDQMYKLNKLIFMSRCHPDYCEYKAMCDESHKIMFPEVAYFNQKRIETPELFVEWGHKLTKYELVLMMFGYAVQIISTSATPCRNLFGDEYPIQKILRIIPPRGYRGVTDMEYHAIPPLAPGVEPHQDPAFQEFVTELADTPMFSKDMYSLKEDHPVFALINVSTKMEDHSKVNDYVHKTFPEKFCTIVYNSGPIKVRFTQKIAEKLNGVATVNLRKKKHIKKTISDMNTALFPSNTPIHNVIQMLADLHGLCERIMLIGGEKIEQGKRINSQDFRLGVSEEFYRPSKNGRMDNILQGLRIVGIRTHGIRTRVFCESEVHEDIIKAYLLTQEIISKTYDELNAKDDSETSCNILKRLSVFEGKCPKKNMCKIDIPMKKVGIKTKDSFEYNIEKYNDTIEVSIKGETKEDEKDKEVNTGKYTIIDQSVFTKGTQIYKMIGDCISLIDDNNMNEKNIELTILNEWLRNSKYPGRTDQQLHGVLWTSIRNNKSLEKTDNSEKRNSFLYWKDANKCYVKYNN